MWVSQQKQFTGICTISHSTVRLACNGVLVIDDHGEDPWHEQHDMNRPTVGVG